MTDRNKDQNQPKPGQPKSTKRSKDEPASVADDRGNIADRNRRNLDGDLERAQQDSGMNDPVSDSNRNRSDRSQDPDRGNQ